jgi:hypothetical protein
MSRLELPATFGPLAHLRRLLMLAAFALLAAAPTAAWAECHAACCCCQKWYVVSKTGFGFLRNHVGICPACLSKCDVELRTQIIAITIRLEKCRRQDEPTDPCELAKLREEIRKLEEQLRELAKRIP